MTYPWSNYFPHEKPRPEQVEIIDFCVNSFKDKRFVVVEAGTGVGKSAVGVTVARYMNSQHGFSAHFTTTQKILQEQYIDDFSTIGMCSV